MTVITMRTTFDNDTDNRGHLTMTATTLRTTFDNDSDYDEDNI